MHFVNESQAMTVQPSVLGCRCVHCDREDAIIAIPDPIPFLPSPPRLALWQFVRLESLASSCNEPTTPPALPSRELLLQQSFAVWPPNLIY